MLLAGGLGRALSSAGGQSIVQQADRRAGVSLTSRPPASRLQGYRASLSRKPLSEEQKKEIDHKRSIFHQVDYKYRASLSRRPLSAELKKEMNHKRFISLQLN